MTTQEHKAFIEACIKEFEAKGNHIKRLPFQIPDIVAFDVQECFGPYSAQPTSGFNHPFLQETGFRGE